VDPQGGYRLGASAAGDRAAGQGLLAGLRVVELASIGPSPHACKMLADLGADVVRMDRHAAHLSDIKVPVVFIEDRGDGEQEGRLVRIEPLAGVCSTKSAELVWAAGAPPAHRRSQV
jgi:CoA-transferase family III